MQRTCHQCQASFEITDADLAFYKKVSPMFGGRRYDIPPPTLCPDCRQQQRLLWRNERGLHRRTCGLTGRNIVAMYPQESPHTIYALDAWWGDGWDAKDYAREYDFNRPFFEQFHDLFKKVPQPAMAIGNCENSDYTNFCDALKNCYLVFTSDRDQDSYYCDYLWNSKNCVDCLNVEASELCYECFDCYHCHTVLYSQKCRDSFDLLHCFDCQGCRNCFACAGLRRKSFFILNEQRTEAEYKEIINNPEKQHEVLQKFDTLKCNIPRRFAELMQCENAEGDYLRSCKNVRNCFNSFDLEDAAFVENSPGGSRDVYDVSGCNYTELGYEIAAIASSYHICFCTYCFQSIKDSLYCISCNGGSNLFGCSGLKSQHYCILNKQYTKQEYEELVPRIIAHMRDSEEWGEFFPHSIAPFGYNETAAQTYFPLSKKEALAEGWPWRERTDDIQNVTKVIAGSQLPAAIAEIPDDILNWAVTCEATGRPFKIIKQELDFYRQMQLSVPHAHPDERHRRRMALRNPRKLWARQCGKCLKEIQTTYAPERPERVVCEKCYLAAVY